MINIRSSAVLTFAIGAVVASGASHAVVVNKVMAANAPAHCQAFTPGPSNTIRNRVIGSENVGPSPIAVACTFEKPIGESASYVQIVDMWFTNNNAAGTINVNCTLLTGYQGQGGAVIINKSVNIAAGEQEGIDFTADDTPDGADVDLGDHLVGVNCTLPTGAVINDTYIYWQENNGVAAP